MANSTVELRHLMKTKFRLFDFDYQFDDKAFKKQLEQAVTDFYYSYEIGQETPGMFKQKFKARWMRMIGYYNDLYNTTLLTYDPLTNYSIKERTEQLSKAISTQSTTQNSNLSSKQDSKNSITATGQAESTGGSTSDQTTTSTTSGSSSNNSNTKTSDYPQQAIAGGNFLNGESVTKGDTSTSSNSTSKTESEQTNTELTNTQDSSSNIGQQTGTQTSDTSNESTSENESNSEYEKAVEGITGITYQELVRQQRDNLLRIPDMVINELKPCFILVY